MTFFWTLKIAYKTQEIKFHNKLLIKTQVTYNGLRILEWINGSKPFCPPPLTQQKRARHVGVQ